MSLFSSYFEFTRHQLLVGPSSVPTYIADIKTQLFLYTAANYGTGVLSFESILLSDGTRAASTILATVAGVEVVASEITSTSTDYVRVRSAGITLVDATVYEPRIKTSGTMTTTWGSAHPRLIFDANYRAVGTPVEVSVQLWSYWNWGGIGWGTYTSPYRDGFLNADVFRYEPKNWEPGTLFYHEALIYVTGAGFTGTLGIVHEEAGNLSVAVGEVSTSSTTQVRVRSSAFTLTEGVDHFMAAKSTGSNSSEACGFDHSRIVAVVPLGTKFELHHPLSSGFENADQTAVVKYVASRVEFNKAVWTERNVRAVYFDALISVPTAGVTGFQDLAYWLGPSLEVAIAGTEISRTTNTWVDGFNTRSHNIKSALFGLPVDSLDFLARWRVSSAATTDFMSGGKLVFVYQNDLPDIRLNSDAAGADIAMLPESFVVTTSAATSVAGTTATLNGEVVTDGM